ncbi:hypothetical protein L3Q82_002838 [Scortum barcoo]|uniref:Uncharacterized protein n=1 Tax=Scortum barcoo TaxID=214431 RepID=A0ACB8VV57_9TELE|nr:hypothetical protein L3Q82_002838 [Scortum barcoo]
MQEALQGSGGAVGALGVSPVHMLHSCCCGDSSTIYRSGGAHAARMHQVGPQETPAMPKGGDVLLLQTARSSSGLLPVKRGGSPGMRRALVSQLEPQDFPPQTLTSVTLTIDGNTTPHLVLIDSWANDSVMDRVLAQKLGLKTQPLDQPVSARSLDGKLLSKITHWTQPLVLTIDSCYQETIQFHIFDCAHHPLILGFPWLKNPYIMWESGKVNQWGPVCHVSCLVVSDSAYRSEGGCGGFYPGQWVNYPDLSKVPPCYHDLREVFSKSKVTSLPPHRHWDCVIDLLPGAPIPEACLSFLVQRGKPWMIT